MIAEMGSMSLEGALINYRETGRCTRMVYELKEKTKPSYTLPHLHSNVSRLKLCGKFVPIASRSSNGPMDGVHCASCNQEMNK